MKYISEIRSRLITWGVTNNDDFPWRNPESLYESVVAEIMLIRTPAEQVLPVYNKFINKFPKAGVLVKATIDDIEKEIKELGLKWRAKRLKDMSLYFINNSISDKINLSIEELKQIPGVGDYASSAIFTFYYSKRSVPVDSNTVRFIKRFYGREFKGEARRNKELYNIINEIIPDEDDTAVKFNESFLDFMRKVCQPRDPNCITCSLRDICSYPEF